MISKILKKTHKAFTLFEVMIALAILSIAMIAGLVTTNSVLEKTVYVERKILAHWVGMNVVKKLQLKLLKEELDVANSTGTENMRGIDFDWNLTIKKTTFNNEELYNVQVDVLEKNNQENMILDTITRRMPIT